MLEQLRRNSRSFIIWILFAMIIGAFVFTFGAQGQVNPSCSGGAPDTLMTIDDHEVSSRAWQFYMGVVGEGTSRPQRTQRALDMVLQREILALAAEDAGFRITDGQIEEELKRGYVYLGGARQDARSAFFRDGVFDFEYLKRLVFNQWNMPSIELFIAQQQREMLANAMAMLIVQSAAASPEEAMARFRHEQTQVTLDAVRFRPFQYRTAVERVLTDADVEAYLASHGDEVQAAYDADKDTKYKDVGLQVRVRQIRFNRAPDEPAKDGEQPAGAGGEAGASDKPAAPKPGRVAADKALARLEAGADFAALARQLSEDAQTKNRGGDAGWRRKSAAGLGFPELTAALSTLEKGAHSPVIDTPGGFFILKVEDEREGDLTFDQVKHEIAAKLAVDYYAKENARREAQAALATANAEGKQLEELYEREAAPTTPQFTPEQLQQLPPEIREMLLRQQIEQLQQLQQQLPGSEEGMLGVETTDIPAAWTDQPGEGAGAGAGAGNAGAPAAPKRAPPADAESADAESADSADSAAGEAAAPEPSAEIPRPAPEDLPTPKVKRQSNVQRDAEGYVPGLGKSEALVRALFDELEPGQFADQVFELDDGFAIVQLISRSEPNLADFEKNQDERVKYLGIERGQRALDSWVKSRCRSLAEQNKIRVNPALVAEVDDDGTQKPVQYSPCQTL